MDKPLINEAKASAATSLPAVELKNLLLCMENFIVSFLSQ
jgi:hypothetical protein